MSIKHKGEIRSTHLYKNDKLGCCDRCWNKGAHTWFNKGLRAHKDLTMDEIYYTNASYCFFTYLYTLNSVVSTWGNQSARDITEFCSVNMVA